MPAGQLKKTTRTKVVRNGPPIDDDEDYSLPIWAGVLPISQQLDEPVPDPKNLAGLEVPAHIRDFKMG